MLHIIHTVACACVSGKGGGGVWLSIFEEDTRTLAHWITCMHTQMRLVVRHTWRRSRNSECISLMYNKNKKSARTYSSDHTQTCMQQQLKQLFPHGVPWRLTSACIGELSIMSAVCSKELIHTHRHTDSQTELVSQHFSKHTHAHGQNVLHPCSSETQRRTAWWKSWWWSCCRILKKLGLAKKKGDVTQNQQVRTECNWLDYSKRKVVGSVQPGHAESDLCHSFCLSLARAHVYTSTHTHAQTNTLYVKVTHIILQGAFCSVCMRKDIPLPW